MSTTALVVLVVSILVLASALVAGLIGWLRHKSTAGRARLNAELSCEPPIRGPERATYRGTTGGYSRVAGSGSIALTERRLIFQKLVGGAVDISLSDVSAVSLAKTFNRSVVANRVHLVVHTGLGDVGYLVADPDEWLAAIQRAIPRLSAH